MDTKLRKTNKIIKIGAFLALIIAFGLFAQKAISLLTNEGMVNSFFYDDYVNGDHSLYTARNDITQLFEMKNEEYIKSDEYIKKNFSEEYLKEISKEELNNFIAQSFYELNRCKTELSNLKGIYYYAESGETVLTNCNLKTPDEFKKYKYYSISDGYQNENTLGGNKVDTNYNIDYEKTKIYFAYDNGFVAEKQTEIDQNKAVTTNILIYMGLLLLLGILAFIYIIYAVGRNKNGEFHLYAFDRLWTDLNICIIIILAMLYLSFLSSLFYTNNTKAFIDKMSIVIILMSSGFCAATLAFICSLIRHIKNKTMIKHSMIYTLWQKIKYILKFILKKSPLNMKIIISVLAAQLTAFIGAIALTQSDGHVFVFLVLILITVLILYFIIRFILKPYDDEVNDRLESALTKEIKAEQLKTELITNVSHDLKTPLTGILNYADLLLKQDENNEYAKVIYDKGQKLKSLTEDLFDISKAQSKNMIVNLEKIDISELIHQTLAEVDSTDVLFKVNVPNLYIMADGKLMSRVFENLVGNIVKYSLANTRAYIEAYIQNGKVCCTFKNIAGYEMNFDASEMVERFSRGDSSRTTEGNGLGLAIALSYTEACGGRLKIDVDGDLFKVTVEFDKI